MKTDTNDTEWADGKLTFPLSKPVMAHGDMVKELVLREPTGADIIAVGNPVQFDPVSSPPRVQIDDARMAAMICRLATVPQGTVAALPPKDLINLGWSLASFFMPI
ncbi:phage tail assembly protein [Labrys neptuniae]|uniref:phage tail assembly protein n=1 Tax=Labrys neptuniae TaxID=376174 RepID=UPI00289095B8|nr:phage tail assembly protein [Labrys neptuniae]MDT3382523.1 phage tail assembly protein [Labrys neptuniae]